MSTNFAKMLVWKQDYYVILWRHKQLTPNTNDYPMPLNEPPPWKVSAYATASWNAKSCNICHSKYCRKKATLTAIFHVLITTSRIFTRLNFFRLFHLHWSHLHSKAADRVLHDPNVRSFYSDCHTFLGRFLDKHGRGACPNSTGNNHCLDYDDTKFRSKSVAA